MNMIELLKAVVLGMTEGFTEWLPVSAAAHLMLMEGILRPESGGEVLTALHAALQLGASFAALLMYWPRLNFLGGKPKKRKAAVRLCTELLVGTVPTAILGFLLFDWIQSRLRNGYLISLMLILFGAVLLIVERGRRYRKPETDLLRKLNPHMALYIGMFQVLGLIPGVSRAGAAILGALLFGCSARTAAEFSVILGIPLTAGAAALTLVRKGIPSGQGALPLMAAGFAAAFIVSFSAIRFLVMRAKKKNYAAYGWYRIAVGAVFLVWTFLTALVAA